MISSPHRVPTSAISSIAVVVEDEDPRIEPALELERRLYESAVAGLDQIFAKEGIVGTFLTSGAIVAFVYSVQSLAQLAPLVGRRSVFVGVFGISVAFVLLIVSGFKFAGVLKGKRVKDVSEGLGFMNKGSIPGSRQEALLKLMKEYRNARKRHEILIMRRTKGLYIVLSLLGSSIFFSSMAVLVALGSLALHKLPLGERSRPPSTGPLLISTRQAYNDDMAEKPPIKLPRPGPGTIMIKGGGGNGK